VSTPHAAAGRPRDPDVDRRIAQAALDLFADAGWAGFAMEAVARRAGVGKASLYLRWNSKEALLADALTLRLARVTDVDTGTLRGDLVELATQMLDIYAGDTSRVALRGELAAGTPVTLLLDTLTGGAMMHAMTTPPDKRADLARNLGSYAEQLVGFLLRAVSVPAAKP